MAHAGLADHQWRSSSSTVNMGVPGTLDGFGEIAWERTVLAFDSEGAKTRFERLQLLFGIAVEWPRLEPLIRRLINLPHSCVTEAPLLWAHKLHEGNAIYRRVHSIKYRPARLLRLARHFVRPEDDHDDRRTSYSFSSHPSST